MNEHEKLVKAILARLQKRTEFNGGILTADRYVRTVLDCVGSDECYKYACNKGVSFDDILRKSASNLTYNNEEMVVEDIYGKPGEWRDDKQYVWMDKDGDQRELPKHTLMVFKHTLTTPRKDRDGDILRTQGARPDLKMPLLWQHIPTLPIGKLLSVSEHTSKKLVVVSAIIDINALAHDAAVMVDAKMGRYSHGFRALEFSTIKEDGYEESGFDIKSFEIMEESLVSVPSNTDAETEEILLSLVEGNKLTSPLLKSMGRSIRGRRNTTVGVPVNVGNLKLDLNISVKGAGEDHHGTKTQCAGGDGCSCGCQDKPAGAPEKTDGEPAKTAGTDDKEVMVCPKCGEKMAGGTCTKCGYKAESKSAPKNDKGSPGATKAYEPYIYAGQLERSWESMSWSLRSALTDYLAANGVEIKHQEGYNLWTDVIGTYPDHVIALVDGGTAGRRYYRISWKNGDQGPEYTGAVKEVVIRTETKIIEKSVGIARALKNCGTGAGGFQPGNTCASGSSGDSQGEQGTTREGMVARFRSAISKLDGAWNAVSAECDSIVRMVEDALADLAKGNAVDARLPPILAKFFLADATEIDRKKLKTALAALEGVDRMQRETEELLSSLN